MERLTPAAFVPAGVQRHTLSGLAGSAVLHFAVVAEDALGNFDRTVRSASAQTSVAGVGEVVGLTAVSGRDRIEVRWDPPAETGGFLAGFRVYFGRSPDPENLPVSARSWSMSGLQGATGYPVRVTTVDTFGKESTGRSLLAATWLPNPAGVSLTANGEDVVISWLAAEPESLVQEYQIFRGEASFTDTSTLTPIARTTGHSRTIGTIGSVSGSHFAVATLNVRESSVDGCKIYVEWIT